MKATTFIAELVKLIQPLATQVNLAYWSLNTAHSVEAETEYVTAKQKLLQIYSDRNYFRQLTELRSNSQLDNSTRRQLQLLYDTFLPHQVSTDLLDQIIHLENEIESDFINHRATLHSELIPDNALNEILAKTTDPTQARLAWEASKQIGQLVAPKIIRIAQLRNQSARSLGYANYFELALQTSELNQTELLAILDSLATETKLPFQRFKTTLDQKLSQKFNISSSELYPWHYGDPFFQEVPVTSGINLEPYFETEPIPVAQRFFEEIGLNPQPIISRSDLYERPGKSQHAFCTHIDQSGDVRILCNLRPNQYWLSTLLHELGHGLYDLHHDQALPYLLRTPAHILTTEAVAMLMGRFTKDASWLQEYLGIPASEITSTRQQLQQQLISSQLIFMRWGLVMVHFEAALYQNPEQDLNKLWWNLVESFQLLRRPTDRNQPDWAAKIHIGTAPVYYQNYLLGELTASQIANHLKQTICHQDSLIQNSRIGEYLIQQIFKPGALYAWDELIKRATGAKLNAKAFVNEVNSVNF